MKKQKPNNSTTTNEGGSQSGVAPTPGVRPLTINDTKWTGVCEKPNNSNDWKQTIDNDTQK